MCLLKQQVSGYWDGGMNECMSKRANERAKEWTSKKKNTTDRTRSTRERATERGSPMWRTNTRTHARTHIWTNDVGNISRKRLMTIAFYTRVSAYAHLDLLSLSFFTPVPCCSCSHFWKLDIIIRQNASWHSWATWSKMTELIVALRACLLSVTCSSDGLLV